jgi:hypothetical protein
VKSNFATFKRAAVVAVLWPLKGWRHFISLGVGGLVAVTSLIVIDEILQIDARIAEPVRLNVAYDCDFAQTFGTMPEITLLPFPAKKYIEATVRVSDFTPCDNAIVYSTAPISDTYLEDVTISGPIRKIPFKPERERTVDIFIPQVWKVWHDIEGFSSGQYRFRINGVLNITSRSEFSFAVDLLEQPFFPSRFSSEKPLSTPPQIALRVAPPIDYILSQAVPSSESLDASGSLRAYRFTLSPQQTDFSATFRSQTAQQKTERQLVVWSTLLGIGIGLALEVILSFLTPKKGRS